MSLALTLHLLAVIIWVGGMFFAHMALRPAVSELLQPAQRLPLMLQVFKGFFPWVWVSVILILGSGFWVLFYLHQGETPASQWFMAIIGTLMAVIFAYIYLIPFQRMAAALSEDALPKAGTAMILIRRLIGTNLILGLLVSAVAVMGKYSGF